MAIGDRTDFKIYNDQINGNVFEVVMQFLGVFNEASRGSIVLRPQALRGDFRFESFFLEGADIERRDPEEITDLTDIPLLQEEVNSVKVHGRFHRAMTRNSWAAIGANTDEFFRVYGGQLARKMMKDQVNTSIAAVNAALSEVAALTFDATAGNLTHSALNSGIALSGDAGGEIVAWIMHSKPWYNLVGGAITGNMLEVGAVAVNEGVTGTLNRPVIITDSPSLIVAGTPANYITLGLRRGAVECIESEALYTAIQEMTGKKNLYTRMQSEWAFNAAVKGFRWNSSIAHPTDAQIATGANWVKKFSDNKSLGGIRITSQ